MRQRDSGIQAADLSRLSDASDADPIHSFEIITGELRAFSEALTEKPMIVVATKLDATTDRSRLEELRSFCREHNLELHSISAATGDGVRELVRSIADALDKIPKAAYETSLDLGPVSNDKAGTPSSNAPVPFKEL